MKAHSAGAFSNFDLYVGSFFYIFSTHLAHFFTIILIGQKNKSCLSSFNLKQKGVRNEL
jgi:hypothetical protein